MGVKVGPLLGVDRSGKEIDAGIDQIMLDGVRIGFVARAKNSPLQFLTTVPEAVANAAKKLADDRDFGDLSDDKRSLAEGNGRKVYMVKSVSEDEGQD